MDKTEILFKLLTFLPPTLIGIICHEIAHGYVAYLFGDPTAKNLGRLTLNPIKHIDSNGAIVFLLTTLFAPFAIGWAKPVPVNYRNIKDLRIGMMLIAAAGPLTNFIIAIAFAFILKISLQLGVDSHLALAIMVNGIYINCILGWFNLFPLPPLDGGHIITSILPRPIAYQFERIGKFGFLILLVLLYTGIFWNILEPFFKNSILFIQFLTNMNLTGV